MKKLRLGVVGLGHRGRSMFQWVAHGIDGIEAVAACDLNPDLFYKEVTFYYGGHHPSLQSEMPGVSFFKDYDEMLDKAGLDVVMIETPATCHAEFCIKALGKGIHVYSDIPSVASLKEAEMLWKAQRVSEAMLMTGATTCGWGFVLAMQNLYKQKFLGKPYYLEAEYIHDCRPLWDESPWRKPGSGNHRYPISYCTHSLGPLLTVMEEELRTVICVSTGSHVTDIPEAEDLMTAIYKTPSGVMVRQTNSSINNCSTGHHSFRIFGTEGYFEHLSCRGQHPERTAFSSTKLYGSKTLIDLPISFMPEEVKKRMEINPHAAFGHGGADSYLWNSFVDSLRRGDKQAPIDLRAGLRMTLPGIYAAESARRNGDVVVIRYPWEKEWKNTF